MAKITVLSPVGGLYSATTSVPPLPGELRGLTVGFLDNTKHNFDRLVEGMGAVLVERFGVARVVHLEKGECGHGGVARDRGGDLVFGTRLPHETRIPATGDPPPTAVSPDPRIGGPS